MGMDVAYIGLNPNLMNLPFPHIATNLWVIPYIDLLGLPIDYRSGFEVTQHESPPYAIS